MQTNSQMPAMGVLKLQETQSKSQLTRHAPSPDLAFFVKHYWIIHWDLTGQAPHLQHVVPNPCVNLVIDRGKSGIFGPGQRKFSYQLQGKGSVFGVKFKPGAFYPFLHKPVSRLMERPLAVQDLFGGDDRTRENEFLSLPDDALNIARAESMIRSRLPEQDETVELLGCIMDRMQNDHELTRVDDVCRAFGVHIRKLQRLFDQYVGVSPKWVLMLFRLQNAAATIDNGGIVNFTRLAADLGYYDQSHFIKDFRTVIGETPEDYARQRG